MVVVATVIQLKSTKSAIDAGGTGQKQGEADPLGVRICRVVVCSATLDHLPPRPIGQEQYQQAEFNQTKAILTA